MGSLIPYLNFDSNKCHEAMSFYQECLGGDLNIMRVREQPQMAAKMPAEMIDSVLHAELKSGKLLMYGSDLNRDMVEGNTIRLCINCDSEEELRKLVAGMSAGGSVRHPVSDMPWGALYAEVLDKYQKNWVFNFQKVPM